MALNVRSHDGPFLWADVWSSGGRPSARFSQRSRHRRFVPLPLSFPLEHLVHSRMWKAATAVVVLGVVMVAVALSSDELEWVGWTGLLLTVAGVASLAAAARTAAETVPRPATEPHGALRPARPTAQERGTSPRPAPTPATTRPAKETASQPSVAASAGRGAERGPRQRDQEPVGPTTATVQPATSEPDPSVIELLAAVPGLGPSKQRALAVAFPRMEQLEDATVEDLTAIDRVGPKVAGRIASLRGATVEDLLADVPGVGPSKRQALGDRFETAPRLMNATEEQIAAVEGVSPAMASRIRRSLDTKTW